MINSLTRSCRKQNYPKFWLHQCIWPQFSLAVEVGIITIKTELTPTGKLLSCFVFYDGKIQMPNKRSENNNNYRLLGIKKTPIIGKTIKWLFFIEYWVITFFYCGITLWQFFDENDLMCWILYSTHAWYMCLANLSHREKWLIKTPNTGKITRWRPNLDKIKAQSPLCLQLNGLTQ